MKATRKSRQSFKLNARGQKIVDKDGFAVSRFTFITTRRTCVAVKIDRTGIQVRDTKDPSKTTLSFNRAEWIAFIKGVKDGEFDP